MFSTKRLWALHSWLGLVSGLALLIVGLTGSALVFRDEIDGLLAPERVSVRPEIEGAERLSFDRLLAGARGALPEYEISGWQVFPGTEKPDKVYVVAQGTEEWQFVALDPYRGEVLSEPAEGNDTFTGWLLELHYSFFTDHIGLLIVGIFGVILCLLGVSGVWLYRGLWKTLFTLRWGRSARIFFSDVHKMVGISSVAFNLILGFTGAWWNLTHLIGHLREETPETAAAEAPGGDRHYADDLSFDGLAAKLRERLPGFQLGFLALPDREGGDVTLYGTTDAAGPLRSPYGCQGVFDAQTGELKNVVDIREAGGGAQILDAFVPLHFGTFGGLPVKILWCVLGLAPGTLAVSGFLIWKSRRKNRAREKKSAQTRKESEPEAAVPEIAVLEPAGKEDRS